jgi:hypothetical protein
MNIGSVSNRRFDHCDRYRHQKITSAPCRQKTLSCIVCTRKNDRHTRCVSTKLWSILWTNTGLTVTTYQRNTNISSIIQSTRMMACITPWKGHTSSATFSCKQASWPTPLHICKKTMIWSYTHPWYQRKHHLSYQSSHLRTMNMVYWTRSEWRHIHKITRMVSLYDIWHSLHTNMISKDMSSNSTRTTNTPHTRQNRNNRQNTLSHHSDSLVTNNIYISHTSPTITQQSIQQYSHPSWFILVWF